MAARKSKSQTTGASNASFEAKLWASADALRHNVDAAEYKHAVLGIIFLKYISDAFEAKHKELEAQKKRGADPEDPDLAGSVLCCRRRSPREAGGHLRGVADARSHPEHASSKADLGRTPGAPRVTLILTPSSPLIGGASGQGLRQ